jgi:hypothetical protein
MRAFREALDGMTRVAPDAWNAPTSPACSARHWHGSTKAPHQAPSEHRGHLRRLTATQFLPDTLALHQRRSVTAMTPLPATDADLNGG